MTATTTSAGEIAYTLLISCPVCESDAGEPRGVTGRMDDPGEAIVVMRCESCSLVYLSPAESAPRASATPPELESPDRWLRRLADGLPPDANVLVLDSPAGWLRTSIAQYGGPQWRVSAAGDEAALQRPAIPASLERTGPYDLVILPGSLESAAHPVDLLGSLAAALTPGGRIVLLAFNPGSSCFAMFGGRHWSGYRHPHTRQFLHPDSISPLCRRAGLRLRQSRTQFSSRPWLHSLANLLDDWGAPRTLKAVATGPWLVPQLMAAAFEAVALLRNRAALLLVELERQ